MATLQELQELRTRRLQEPPIPQVQATNPKAPDTTPKLPNEIVTNPEDTRAGMSEPKMSDYQFNQNFYKQYMQKPVTQEEEDRRKRAAQSAQAIAGLGSVISAFSNLAFSGEAPSQTLPQLPQVDYLSFSDRLKQQRDQYGAGLVNARARDYSEYLNALNSYLTDQYRKQQYEMQQRNYERQMRKDANQLAMDQEKMKMDKEKNEFDRAYKTASLAQNDRKINIEAANSQSMADYRKAQAESKSKSKDKIKTIYGVNGKMFDLPESIVRGFSNYAYRRMFDTYKDLPKEQQQKFEYAIRNGNFDDPGGGAFDIVSRNMQYFPQLYDEFDRYIKNEVRNKSLQWPSQQDRQNIESGSNNGEKKIGWKK